MSQNTKATTCSSVWEKAPDDERRDSKGKEKVSNLNFTNRLQESGQMLLTSLLGTQPEFATTRHIDKIRGSGASSNTDALLSFDTHLTSIWTTKSSPQDTWKGTYQSTQEEANNSYRAFLDKSAQLVQHVHPTNELSGSSAALDAIPDGTEAVKLLESFDDDPYSWVEEDTTPWHGVETQQVRALTPVNELGEHTDLYDFTPNFLSDGSIMYEESKMCLGITDLAEAQQTWRQYWGKAISSYTDDVWSGFGLQLSSCKVENSHVDHLASMNSGTGALNRLQQIVAHIRGRW